MAEILVLGAGAMGSAFCFPAADAGHSVRLVGTHLDQQWIRSIRETRFHPKLKLKLPPAVVPFFHDQLGQALAAGVDLVVLGVSSAGVRWAVERLGGAWTGRAPVLMLTKGLEALDDGLRIFPDTVREGLQAYGIREAVGAVGGPCIAGELAARRHTSVVIGYRDAQTVDAVTGLLAAPYYHVRPSLDLVGLEVCAALKNFYALAVGCPSGMLAAQKKAANGALMHNLSAGAFTQALSEMGRLVEFLGGSEASVAGLAGTGDLYVTCQAGRNSRMGYLLGSGVPYSVAKSTHMADETVEGAELAFVMEPVFERLFSQRRLDPEAFPLTRAILEAVCHDAPMDLRWPSFYCP
jgi:glycerol-3-phosphate dehydrogenase (NAD(P)+)